MGSGFFPDAWDRSALRSKRFTKDVVGGMGLSSVAFSERASPWCSDKLLGLGGAAGLGAALLTVPASLEAFFVPDGAGCFAREAASEAAWYDGDVERLLRY